MIPKDNFRVPLEDLVGHNRCKRCWGRGYYAMTHAGKADWHQCPCAKVKQREEKADEPATTG